MCVCVCVLALVDNDRSGVMCGYLCVILDVLSLVFPSEKGPVGAVQEAQQQLLVRVHELPPPPEQGRLHLHHLQQHGSAAEDLRGQAARLQKDLQQREQDRQDVAHRVPRAVRDLQPGVLGHVPQQRTRDQGS